MKNLAKSTRDKPRTTIKNACLGMSKDAMASLKRKLALHVFNYEILIEIFINYLNKMI